MRRRRTTGWPSRRYPPREREEPGMARPKKRKRRSLPRGFIKKYPELWGLGLVAFGAFLGSVRYAGWNGGCGRTRPRQRLRRAHRQRLVGAARHARRARRAHGRPQRARGRPAVPRGSRRPRLRPADRAREGPGRIRRAGARRRRRRRDRRHRFHHPRRISPAARHAAPLGREPGRDPASLAQPRSRRCASTSSSRRRISAGARAAREEGSSSRSSTRRRRIPTSSPISRRRRRS